MTSFSTTVNVSKGVSWASVDRFFKLRKMPPPSRPPITNQQQTITWGNDSRRVADEGAQRNIKCCSGTHKYAQLKLFVKQNLFSAGHLE